MKISDTWHTFMLRKTLLTHWSVCFEFMGPNMSFRDPIIRNTVSSLLCVDLLSILDESIEVIMTPEDYDRGRKMKNRLEMLNKAGRLRDFGALDAIRERRNDIGHEFDKGATVEELDQAVGKVKEQLLDWDLIEDSGDYDLTFEKTAMRDTDVEGYICEHDLVIRINLNGKTMLEMKQTRRLAKG